jgi:GGDEF domain-containing protein
MQPASKQPPSKPSEQAALENCLLTLLRGIQNHSVIADGSDGQEFRAQLAALESRFKGESQFKGPDDTHQLVDSAVALLDKYGTQADQVLARQKSGLAAAATELSQAVKTLPEIQRSAERFSRLEEQIDAISTRDGIDVIKARLSVEIATARADTLQEIQKISELFSGVAGKLDVISDGGLGQVQEQIMSQTGPPPSLAQLPDPLTGLASRSAAEAELARVCSQPEDCYLALFVVKRLALINAKFGYSRGDQVLLKVVLHLSQSLPDYKSFFRWAPCAFLTVAPPNISYKELRGKVQIIEHTRLTPTLVWEGRSAIVPVVIDCRTVSAKDFGTTSDLFLRLDTLAADA